MPSHLISNSSQSQRNKLLRGCIFALLICSTFLVTAAARSETMVIGPVSGFWDDTLYIVTGDIFITERQSLVIAPGTIIRFAGDFRFDVHGLLSAEGTPGLPIVFYGENEWNGLSFFPTASPNSVLQNCTISNAFIGVQLERAFLRILNSTIIANNTAIRCIQSNPVIASNKKICVDGSGDENFRDVFAIDVRSGSTPQIHDNELIEAIAGMLDAYGIWIQDSTPSIRNNWIEVSSASRNAIGIYAYRTIKVGIDHNIIRLRSVRSMQAIWLQYATNVIITSNDLLLMSNAERAICVNVGLASVAQITNNILYGNGHSVGDSSVYGQIDPTYSGYNDYFNHAENTIHVGEWQGSHDVIGDPMFIRHVLLIDSCDYNLYLERDDQEKIYLNESSPCINAGSPEIYDDFRYGTPSDIGKYPQIYDPAELSVVEIIPKPVDYTVVTAFPNPFNRSTTLSFDLALPGLASVFVFDVNGRQLATLWNGPMGEGYNRLVWSAGAFPAGEYLIRLELPGHTTQTQKVNFLP